jgi:hypothetical protein
MNRLLLTMTVDRKDWQEIRKKKEFAGTGHHGA